MFVWNAIRRLFVVIALAAIIAVPRGGAQEPSKSNQITIGGIVPPRTTLALKNSAHRLSAPLEGTDGGVVEVRVTETTTMANRYDVTVHSALVTSDRHVPYIATCDGAELELDTGSAILLPRVGERVLRIAAGNTVTDTLTLTVVAR